MNAGNGPIELSTLLSPSASAIVEWLADVGSRWGLPPDACRIHGLLYLMARPLSTKTIVTELALSPGMTEEALVWLVDEELITGDSENWTTEADPWLLMLQTLEKRRQQELSPALRVLGYWRQFDRAEDPQVARQAKRLLDLVEDFAAIDAGAKRLSPHALRRVIGLGGRAARLLGAGDRKRNL
jgi:DNA-binding transcriptional regulator GbsR (MarR family)